VTFIRNCYTDIYEDVREECSKFGKVYDIKIPRPIQGNTLGVGKVCLLSIIMSLDLVGIHKAGNIFDNITRAKYEYWPEGGCWLTRFIFVDFCTIRNN
jgi:hypothetical protein